MALPTSNEVARASTLSKITAEKNTRIQERILILNMLGTIKANSCCKSAMFFIHKGDGIWKCDECNTIFQIKDGVAKIGID